jgi:hypothetical protein
MAGALARVETTACANEGKQICHDAMNTLAPKPALPAKVYLRRGDVEKAVGGQRQMMALESTGKLRGIKLPGYTTLHFIRADVQAVLDEMWGR